MAGVVLLGLAACDATPLPLDDKAVPEALMDRARRARAAHPALELAGRLVLETPHPGDTLPSRFASDWRWRGYADGRYEIALWGSGFGDASDPVMLLRGGDEMGHVDLRIHRPGRRDASVYRGVASDLADGTAAGRLDPLRLAAALRGNAWMQALAGAHPVIEGAGITLAMTLPGAALDLRLMRDDGSLRSLNLRLNDSTSTSTSTSALCVDVEPVERVQHARGDGALRMPERYGVDVHACCPDAAHGIGRIRVLSIDSLETDELPPLDGRQLPLKNLEKDPQWQRFATTVSQAGQACEAR